MLNIRFEKISNPKPLPTPENPLTFGTIFTDHMFVMDYEDGKGWIDPRIIPMDRFRWILPVWFFIMDRKCLKD